MWRNQNRNACFSGNVRLPISYKRVIVYAAPLKSAWHAYNIAGMFQFQTEGEWPTGRSSSTGMEQTQEET